MRHRFDPLSSRPCLRDRPHGPLARATGTSVLCKLTGLLLAPDCPPPFRPIRPTGTYLPLGPCLVNRARANLLGPSRPPRSCGAHRRRPHSSCGVRRLLLGGQALPRPHRIAFMLAYGGMPRLPYSCSTAVTTRPVVTLSTFTRGRNRRTAGTWWCQVGAGTRGHSLAGRRTRKTSKTSQSLCSRAAQELLDE